VLRSEIFTSSNRDANPNLQYAILPDSEYCIESHVKFINDDSISLEWFINGKTAGKLFALVPFTRKFVNISGGTLAAGWDEPCTVAISDFAITDKQPFVPPPRPQTITVNSQDSLTSLATVPFTSSYEGEKLRATEWQLFKGRENIFSLFDVIETDPVKLEECPIPFVLDTGMYFWRTRWKNNFNVWGHFSKSDTFVISSPRVNAFTISGASITTLNDKNKLYKLKLSLRTTTDMARMHYVVAVIRHESYQYGHPGNKGERFQPESNYIINLSRSPNGFIVFEKGTANSPASLRIDSASPSTYIDLSSLSVDTILNTLAINFKLLDQALPGNWQCMVYGRDSLNELSNIYSMNFRVTTKKHFLPIRFILPFGLSAVLLLFIAALKRKKSTTNHHEESFNAIQQHIKENIAEKLTIDMIRKKLGMNVNRFYEIMKANNSEFPKLVNSIRIEKAKELLLNPDINISSVGFDVGYGKPGYFSQIFKEHTGLTPMEYRKANEKRSLI
jgi:AraC-like DNA-binding protein